MCRAPSSALCDLFYHKRHRQGPSYSGAHTVCIWMQDAKILHKIWCCYVIEMRVKEQRMIEKEKVSSSHLLWDKKGETVHFYWFPQQPESLFKRLRKMNSGAVLRIRSADWFYPLRIEIDWYLVYILPIHLKSPASIIRIRNYTRLSRKYLLWSGPF